MRYLIFAGETYYADGGAHDLVASCADGVRACEEAAEIYRKLYGDGARDVWCHVYDLEKAKIVWNLGRSFGDT